MRLQDLTSYWTPPDESSMFACIIKSSTRKEFLMLSRFLSILFITLWLGGCATMANIDQQIAVTTIPDGADVRMGNITSVTPMSATVPGGYGIPQSIQISKEGYQPQTVSVQRGFRTGALVQDFFPGLLLGPIPLIIDAITGDWWYVANASYTIRLIPIAGHNPDTKTDKR